MVNPAEGLNQLAIDANSLNDLRRATKENSPESIKAAAKQFEALFVGMMLKSMREASSGDSLFDTEQSKMFIGMLDQQLSQKMAERGVGLAEVLAKQMMMKSALEYDPNKPAPVVNTSLGNTVSASTEQPAHVKNFENKLAGYAEQASQVTGIPAKFMLGQAALESGWGKREILHPNGQSSHNLFGIKADSSWTGKVVSVATTEYVNGAPVKKIEKFRSYDNYAESFADYAKFLQGNQRYKNVLANAKDAYGFAQGLQNAGYATDPQYADKLINVITKNLSA